MRPAGRMQQATELFRSARRLASPTALGQQVEDSHFENIGQGMADEDRYSRTSGLWLACYGGLDNSREINS